VGNKSFTRTDGRQSIQNPDGTWAGSTAGAGKNAPPSSNTATVFAPPAEGSNVATPHYYATYELLSETEGNDRYVVVTKNDGQYGDREVGNSYEAIGRFRNADGTYETITTAFFIEPVDESDDATEYHIVEMTERITHTDPDDPGGTELGSEIEHNVGADMLHNYARIEDAEEDAKSLAEFTAKLWTETNSR